jgi:hypothetical protein
MATLTKTQQEKEPTKPTVIKERLATNDEFEKVAKLILEKYDDVFRELAK